MKVYNSNLPANSDIINSPPTNYVDVYACEICVNKDIYPDDILINFWVKKPKCIEFFLKLRNL